jgi:predicted TIM-barrel fold metal-dependent hydrolase
MTTLAAADYRIVDSHVHTWKHDPEFPFAPGANVPARDAAPETLLELMKANGVSKTVIIQVIHYRYDNRFLERVLKQYPGTFKGVCWTRRRRTSFLSSPSGDSAEYG